MRFSFGGAPPHARFGAERHRREIDFDEIEARQGEHRRDRVDGKPALRRGVRERHLALLGKNLQQAHAVAGGNPVMPAGPDQPAVGVARLAADVYDGQCFRLQAELIDGQQRQSFVVEAAYRPRLDDVEYLAAVVAAQDDASSAMTDP